MVAGAQSTAGMASSQSQVGGIGQSIKQQAVAASVAGSGSKLLVEDSLHSCFPLQQQPHTL